MTLKDKLRKDHPNMIVKGENNKEIVLFCPATYGYENRNQKCILSCDDDCEKCWNREYQEKTQFVCL